MLVDRARAARRGGGRNSASVIDFVEDDAGPVLIGDRGCTTNSLFCVGLFSGVGPAVKGRVDSAEPEGLVPSRASMLARHLDGVGPVEVGVLGRIAVVGVAEPEVSGCRPPRCRSGES